MKKIAVITGASAGMGREFVLQLPRWETFDEMWVIARRREALEALQQEVSCPVRAVPLDLTDPAAWQQYADLLAAEQPEVALLVNAAGFGRFALTEAVPTDIYMNMIDLNCKALVAMTQATLPYMKKGSRVLQLASLSSFQPVPYINVYAATKAFVMSYSRALNRELKTRGIRMMSMNPAWVKTEFFDHAIKPGDDAVTYFNVMYEARDVVATGLHDLYRTKKDVSIHGLPIKLQVLGVKLLPHRLVMNIWMKQQKHK